MAEIIDITEVYKEDEQPEQVWWPGPIQDSSRENHNPEKEFLDVTGIMPDEIYESVDKETTPNCPWLDKGQHGGYCCKHPERQGRCVAQTGFILNTPGIIPDKMRACSYRKTPYIKIIDINFV